MLVEERRAKIVKIVEEQGSATVADLSELLDVSSMTIRRDLTYLADQGRLVRSHGGAVSIRQSTTSEMRYDVKARLNLQEKRCIGALAARLVHDGETILLDSGTTTYHVAANLKDRQNLTVVTNDIKIASLLCFSPEINVLLIGGMVRPGIFSTTGPYAVEMLSQLSVDKTFLSADAVSLTRGVTNTNPDEVPIKRRMLAAGEDRFLVVDYSKFERNCLALVCDLDEVDHIITDSQIPSSAVGHLSERGIDVIVCE